MHGGRLYSDVLKEGLNYIEYRMLGKIKSFKTPWVGVNQAGVGGWEWGSMVTIGARPGAGKTLIVSQILRESRALNPGQDFNILEFQFEMGAKQSAARAFAAHTAADYNLVLSTDKQLDKFIFDKMVDYQKECELLESQGIIRVQINSSLTKSSIRDAVMHYYNELGGKPMIVTIDHSWLIKKDFDEKEKILTLYNTVEMLMGLKNIIPIIVIMITQLNRSVEDPARRVPGSIANYPTSSDIFGGDALMQGSDMVMALSRPSTLNMTLYGSKGYLVSPDDIFVHLLKVRNGSDDKNILFMKAQFNKQCMIEVSEPKASNPSGAPYTRLSQRSSNPTASRSDDDLDVDGIS